MAALSRSAAQSGHDIQTRAHAQALLAIEFDERPNVPGAAQFKPELSPLWRLYRQVVRTQIAYFKEPGSRHGADILKLFSLPARIPGAINLKCPTILLDLRPSIDALWNGSDPKTRKVIRQAAREGISVTADMSPECWRQFSAAHANLRTRKRQVPKLGSGHIQDLLAKHQFQMTVSRAPDGTILSWHGYARYDNKVCLVNTVTAVDPGHTSQQNNIIGRANRLHHWLDMLRFKADGVTSYDFGGVYMGTHDQEQANVARFKGSFGGRSADTFDSIIPLTSKGRAALFLIGLARRMASMDMHPSGGKDWS